MPLLHGKQLQNSSVRLDKIVGSGSLIIQTGATFQVPTANILTATDIVNKQYVDALTTGMNPHASVKTITIGNINLASSATVISGYTVSSGDRVLVWQQSITASNGIYVYNGSSFSRATDMDGSPAQEISVGDYTFVTSGTYSGNGYTIVSSGTYSGTLEPVDVAPIVFSQFTGPAAYVWNNGINNVANVIDVDIAGASGLTFAAGSLTIDSNIAGNGLAWNAGILSVNVANGLQIASDNVEIAPSVAGTGLTFAAGVVSIKSTGVSANTYGSATVVPSVTFNAQGQAIAATAVSILITSSQVSDFAYTTLQTALTASRFGNTTTINTSVSAGNVVTALVNSQSLTASHLNNGGAGATAGYILAVSANGAFNWIPASSGSVTSVNGGTGVTVISSGGSATVSISNTGVTGNTYGSATTVPSVTFNLQGQAIAATALSIGIPSGQVSNFTYSVLQDALTASNFGNTTTINHSVSAGNQVTALVNAGSLTASLLNTGGAGATAGYILSVSSTGVFNWIPDSVGSITSVIAGTGITVVTTGGSATVSISNTGVTSTTYGSSTTVPQVTFNLQGQATSATALSIAIPSGQVSNFTYSVLQDALTASNFGNTTTINHSVSAGNQVTALVNAGSLTASLLNTGGAGATAGYVLSVNGGGVFNWIPSSTGAITSVIAGTGVTVISSGGAATVSISNTGVTSTTYGSATTVPQVTFNLQGQATSATALSIAIPSGQVSNFTYSVLQNALTASNFANTTTINHSVSAGNVVTALVNAGSLTASLLNTNSGGATSGYILSVNGGGIFSWIPQTAILGATTGIPVYSQRNTTPSVTTGNGASTGITLTNTPKNNINVQVYVNGQAQYLGDGVTASVDCYFGTSPVAAVSIDNLVSGNTLYWNGTYVGFDLSATDKIDIIYNK